MQEHQLDGDWPQPEPVPPAAPRRPGQASPLPAAAPAGAPAKRRRWFKRGAAQPTLVDDIIASSFGYRSPAGPEYDSDRVRKQGPAPLWRPAPTGMLAGLALILLAAVVFFGYWAFAYRRDLLDLARVLLTSDGDVVSRFAQAPGAGWFAVCCVMFALIHLRAIVGLFAATLSSLRLTRLLLLGWLGFACLLLYQQYLKIGAWPMTSLWGLLAVSFLGLILTATPNMKGWCVRVVAR